MLNWRRFSFEMTLELQTSWNSWRYRGFVKCTTYTSTRTPANSSDSLGKKFEPYPSNPPSCSPHEEHIPGLFLLSTLATLSFEKESFVHLGICLLLGRRAWCEKRWLKPHWQWKGGEGTSPSRSLTLRVWVNNKVGNSSHVRSIVF